MMGYLIFFYEVINFFFWFLVQNDGVCSSDTHIPKVSGYYNHQKVLEAHLGRDLTCFRGWDGNGMKRNFHESVQ